MHRATSTKHQDQEDYGTWTPAFEQLHEAVLTGASPEEIRQLEATELNELATTNTDRRRLVALARALKVGR